MKLLKPKMPDFGTLAQDRFEKEQLEKGFRGVLPHQARNMSADPPYQKLPDERPDYMCAGSAGCKLHPDASLVLFRGIGFMCAECAEELYKRFVDSIKNGESNDH